MTYFAKGLFAFCLLVLALSGVASAATFTVSKIADTNDGTCDSDCSFREAVAASNLSAVDDAIVFNAAIFSTPQTITLISGEIVVTSSGALTVVGPGSNKLTVSGNNASRIISNGTGAVTSISGITLTGGNGVGAANTGRGGAIYNFGGTLTLINLVITGNAAANGGGLNNAGTATLNIINSTVSNNTATGSGGGMQNFSGNFVNVTNSTFSGNTSSSTLVGGGGMQANGTLTFTNVTFSGNTAAGGDGGGLVYNGQGLNMTNVTITGNNATGGGSGGLHKSTSLLNANIRNTIIAGNTGSASPDAFGAFNSQGTNLIGTVGTSTGWIATDLLNQPALLGPLGSYGGLSRTHPLLAGSPAINAGQNCVRNLSCTASNPPIAVTFDQRYEPRSDATVDIGAYEVGSDHPAILPNAGLNQPYNHVIAANNSGFTHIVTGQLPPGITLTSNATQAFLSGTPTVPGTYIFTITVSNTATPSQSRTQIYMLTVSPNPENAVIRLQFTENQGPLLGKTIATLTDAQGNSRTSVVSPFGYVTFDNVPTGGVYTIVVSNKRLGQLSAVVATQGSFIFGPIELSKTSLRESGNEELE